MLLTVEYREDRVEIHFDAEGRDTLVRAIVNLRSRDHAHLKTPSWAGSELTEEPQGTDGTLINHLRLQLWD